MQREIILWGCGQRAELFWTGLKKTQFSVRYVIESNEDKIGKMWHGAHIISFSEYLEKELYSTIIVTPANNVDIVDKLESNNIDNYYVLPKHFGNTFMQNNQLDINTYCDNIVTIMFGQWIEKDFVTTWLNGCCFDEKDFSVVYEKKIAMVSSELNHIMPCSLACGNISVSVDGTFGDDCDLVALWGLGLNWKSIRLSLEAKWKNCPVVFFEDGFIRSVEVGRAHAQEKYVFGRSMVIDEGGLYINAMKPSYLENMLNSERELSEMELTRATRIISKIIDNKVSKYNNQPIRTISVGNPGKKKVLVIDQVYGDASIKYGMADDTFFEVMLEAAIKENPDADIMVKTHPDPRKNHYNSSVIQAGVYFLDYPINPISLLEYADKVYVCTSQMGFEALMCGKEVHVFGMPFYAGWGITKDRQFCSRRNKIRSVEEIFYFAYLEYTRYFSYENGKECTIEQCIDDIIRLRHEYWRKKNGRGS